MEITSNCEVCSTGTGARAGRKGGSLYKGNNCRLIAIYYKVFDLSILFPRIQNGVAVPFLTLE